VEDQKKNKGHSKSSFIKRGRGYNEYQKNFIGKEPIKIR
jgi:hypothetical protein